MKYAEYAKKIGHFAKLCKIGKTIKANLKNATKETNRLSDESTNTKTNQLVTKPNQQKSGNKKKQEANNDQEDLEEIVDPEATF